MLISLTLLKVQQEDKVGPVMTPLIFYILPLFIFGNSVAERELDIGKRFDTTFKSRVYARGGRSGGYTAEEKQLIVEAHNEYRRDVIPPASNMDELIWSDQLAKLAQQWSENCVYEHPARESHPEYNGIGQNLYIKYDDKGGKNPPEPVVLPVTSWHSEESGYLFQRASCTKGKVCGHYTQVAWATTSHVGCGINFCKIAATEGKTSYKNAWIVTCNYSPSGNVQGELLYSVGSPCSMCPTGYCKDGLCSDCDPSERGCECLLECQNCGVKNDKKCSCKCPKGYLGVACEKSCEDTHEACGATPGWPKMLCKNPSFPFVAKFCPKMCGSCKAASKPPKC